LFAVERAVKGKLTALPASLARTLSRFIDGKKRGKGSLYFQVQGIYLSRAHCGNLSFLLAKTALI
jgi:hypothetical protein